MVSRSWGAYWRLHYGKYMVVDRITRSAGGVKSTYLEDYKLVDTREEAEELVERLNTQIGE